jgi:hypothetical protein
MVAFWGVVIVGVILLIRSVSGACLVDHIRWLERRVAAVDRDLDDTIARRPLWRAKEDLLRSMPGADRISGGASRPPLRGAARR